MSEAAAAAAFNTRQIGYLPGVLGFDWVELRNSYAFGRFEIAQQHLAPNGYLHAGSVVALADTACGYGCFMSLPEGASNFTTAELSAIYFDAAKDRLYTAAPASDAQTLLTSFEQTFTALADSARFFFPPRQPPRRPCSASSPLVCSARSSRRPLARSSSS